MVRYRSVKDVIKANQKMARTDRHPHKLRRSVRSIQSLIDGVKESGSIGLTFQAAASVHETTDRNTS